MICWVLADQPSDPADFRAAHGPVWARSLSASRSLMWAAFLSITPPIR